MAPTATQPIRTPSQPGGSISSTGPSLLPPQITQSPGFEAPRSAGRGARETDNAAQPAGNSDSSIRKTFWRDTFPKVINICGILGLLFALIFGITQWVAQDKSIAIAKESELVTLALSCSDEVQTKPPPPLPPQKVACPVNQSLENQIHIHLSAIS